MDRTGSKVVVSAQVAAEVRAQLERLAIANERNVSQELRRAIAEHLARTEHHQGGEE